MSIINIFLKLVLMNHNLFKVIKSRDIYLKLKLRPMNRQSWL